MRATGVGAAQVRSTQTGEIESLRRHVPRHGVAADDRQRLRILRLQQREPRVQVELAQVGERAEDLRGELLHFLAVVVE